MFLEPEEVLVVDFVPAVGSVGGGEAKVLLEEEGEGVVRSYRHEGEEVGVVEGPVEGVAGVSPKAGAGRRRRITMGRESILFMTILCIYYGSIWLHEFSSELYQNWVSIFKHNYYPIHKPKIVSL